MAHKHTNEFEFTEEITMKIEVIAIKDTKYKVIYDEKALHDMLIDLGIENETARNRILRVLTYYTMAPDNKIKYAYEAIANEENVCMNAVVMNIRKALRRAEMNGKLKYIDDYLETEFYDYDFGLTNKQFIATLYMYALTKNLLFVQYAL